MAFGKSLEKPEPHTVTIHYRKDGQPIQYMDKNGNPIPRVRMSKKDRRRRREGEKQ